MTERPTPICDAAEGRIAISDMGYAPDGQVKAEVARTLERDRSELMEALREFIEIDENGAGLLTRHPSGSDLVIAISEARALLARLEG